MFLISLYYPSVVHAYVLSRADYVYTSSMCMLRQTTRHIRSCIKDIKLYELLIQ